MLALLQNFIEKKVAICRFERRDHGWRIQSLQDSGAISSSTRLVALLTNCFPKDVLELEHD